MNKTPGGETTHPSQPGEQPLSVTLKWDGSAGDGKRSYVVAEENDGWQDLRIEVDTDDCDGDHAKRAMQAVIDRVNSHAQSQARIAELEGANAILIGALQEIKRTPPQTVMNGKAKMSDPDHIKGGWNFHMMAREAIESASLAIKPTEVV
jgi:hypothetical protein